MRKHLLSVVALASILVLAGCNTKNTSSSPAVSSSSPKISSSTTTTVAVTGVTLDKTTAELVVGGTVTLTATVSPTTATDKTVTWASSDATVASVAAGVVTAVKAGTANITATSGTQVATCAVTVKAAMPTPTVTTIAALNALTADDTTHLYEVTGILEDKSATDKYGNGYLTDATTGASIKIYGSTTTASAITFTDNALGFINPKDAVTTLADYANGESVTLHCVYKYYNSTPEIMGIMTAHAATTNKYSVTKETATNGSFTVDKETATYGETVTITATPASGYKVGSVDVKTAYLGSAEATVSETNVNVYTFNATCVNKVTVNFVTAETATPDKNLTFSGTPTYGIVDKQSTTTTNTFTDADITYEYLNAKQNSGYLMMYCATPSAYLANTTAFSANVSKVVITTNSTASATCKYYVTFGTTAQTGSKTETTAQTGAGSTLTFTNSATDCKYFNLSVNTKNGQIVTIDIYLSK